MEYELYKNIISDPDICNGKPTIKGTRITVQTIMSFVLAGDSDEQVLDGYPGLKKEDIKICREFTIMIFYKPTLFKNLKANA